jgi:hypothetical protein
MKLFLLTYDRRQQRLLSNQEFEPGQYEEANRVMLEEELAHPELEIVLLEAASLDDLKRTHRRYFEDLTGFLQPA